jgi:hypothetical protein
MFRRGDKNCIEGERRAGPTTERKDEVSTLGPIHLDTPSTAPDFYFMEMILEVIEGCGGINFRGNDIRVVSESCKDGGVVGWQCKQSTGVEPGHYPEGQTL